MLKKFYEDMTKALEAQYQRKPRPFTRINMQLFQSFIDAFKEDAKVVWTSYYSFPMELLAAFDVAPFDFEIATNLLPTVDADGSVQIMCRAEEEGYSTDICSYHRIALGCQMLGYLPRADIFFRPPISVMVSQRPISYSPIIIRKRQFLLISRTV
jgi:benzoyl-CoA reductase/2-hydroxyglutaryl-CoA dehydratase subunit BcrC/BadD/HgdB